jgi:hypothetical protein
VLKKQKNTYVPTTTLALYVVLNSEIVGLGGVARFLSVQHTKTGKNIPDDHKMHQISVKYTV